MNTLPADILTQTYKQLSTFASLENFWDVFNTAFGTEYNRRAAGNLRSQLLSGDFSQFPQIEIIDSSILGNANGAYAISNNKIYLSEGFLSTATSEAIQSVILEEIGHFVDAQVNSVDSAGDEGAIFAALVQGYSLDDTTLQALKAEDDRATITVDGQVVAVEQNSGTIAFSAATYSINENGTPVTAVTLTRTGGSIGIVSATLNLTNGTATAPFDYQNTPITVNFANGETTKTVNFSQVSQGLSFDGINDKVDNNNVIPNLTDTFTIEFWANPTATRNLTNESNSYLDYSGIGGQRYAIFPIHGENVVGSGHAGAGVSVGTNGISVFEHSTDYIPSLLVYEGLLSGWNHIAIVYNNKTPSLYLNGQFIKTGLKSNYIVHPSFQLGEIPGNNNYGAYQGSLDEVRIWNNAKTQAEIQANLNKELTGAESGLVGYWNFNSVKGNTVDDLTSNQNDGTIVEAQTTAGFGAISGTIPIINDKLREGNETVNLTLTNPTNGATIGAQNAATLTIVDNDTSPGQLISENLPLASYSASNTWNSTALPNNAFDGNLSTEWSSGTFVDQWIEVDLGQEYYLDSIQLLIDQLPPGNTTHEVWVSNQSIGNSSIGATLAKTFQGFTDAGQWLQSDFSNSTKGRYVQVKTVSSPSWVNWVEIQIYGEPLISSSSVLAFSQPTFSVNEDGTTIQQVTVTRTGGSSGAVAATIKLTNGTATAVSDYNNTPITVTFAAGEISKIVTIPIVNDTTPEPDETLQLILTNPTGGATIGQQNSATLTIIDNDAALLITGLPQGSSGSNKGQTTIVISGQNFSPNDQISIIAPNGTVKAASKVYWVNETEAWATFNLQGLTTGKYDVKVTNGQNNSVSNDVFTVTDGSLGTIQTQLSYPAQGFVTVNYTNVGETDVTAPLFRILPTNAQVTYPEENTVSATLRQLLNLTLGTTDNGAAGILAPGKSGEFSFAYTPNGNGLISFAVQQVNPSEVINWASIKAESRADYSFIDTAGWDAIWSNLTAAVGTTAGQFQAVMTENANYLSQLGQPTNDVTRLFAFEWKQAVNTLTNVDLLSTTDVVDAAPGLSLTFNRTFHQSIAERYNLGTLGRGWSSQWDLRATTDSQGDVVIRSVGDLQRVFEKQTDGTYLEDGGATLTIVSGQYRLKEATGLVSLFGTDGKLSYVEDTTGNRITLQYTNNLLTKLVHTNGDSLTLAYNAQGRISKITDSTAQSTNYSYDATGERLLSVTAPDGITTYTYDTGSVAAKKYSLLSVTSDLGYQRSFEYDNQGRLTKEFSNGQTQALTYSYDSVGGVTITDSTGASQTILLDDRGNGGQIRGVNNQNLLFSYDADGNLTNATLPNSSQTGYIYDSKGNLTQQTNLLGQSTKFTYDTTFNQLTGFTDPKGNGVNYSYDAKSNLTKITYPDGSFQQLGVDALGNITSAINRRGNTIQYTYNTSGLLTKKQFANGSNVAYSYDTKGNLTSVIDGTGTIAMQYDAANQLTKITYPTGRTLQYTYNADGQRTKLVSQDGYTVNYGYDTVGRLKTLTNATGQSIISYDYDSAGRLIKETNGNGTYTTYQYDLQSQLTRLINYKANNTVNSKFDYAYDNLGQRTSMTTLEGTFQYGYDATGQLTSVITPTNRKINYQYDAAGNRIGVTDNGTNTNYTSNNLNEYTNVGNVGYTYDTDGNLIGKIEGGQTSTYTYDVENRLVKVVNPQGTWEYQYDGLGNRVATVLNGQRTEYLLDPTGLGDIVGEYNGSTLVANYTHGIGLVSRVNGSNSNYYDADAIGSTIGLTATDGSYVNRYSYLPFGEDLTKVEGVANPFEYVGQWGVMDEGNGLDFMRSRFYDSGLGRFTATDPIGVNGQDANLYRYVTNNPIKAVDPQGTFIWVPILAGVGAITGAGLGVASTWLSGYVSGKGTTSGELWGAAATGALYGAVVGGTGGLAAWGTVGSIAGMVGVGAVTSSIGYGVQSSIDGKFNASELGSAALLGGVTGPIPWKMPSFRGPYWGVGNPKRFVPQLLGQLTHGASIWKALGLTNLAGQVPTLVGLIKKLIGGSSGDPHLTTFDGINYDFQGAGEFTFVKSTTDDLEIQTRQQPWNGSTTVTVNTAIAIKAGGQRIALYLNDPNPLKINGTAITLPEGGLYAVGQNLIIRSGNEYNIFTANGDQIQVTMYGSTYINISLGLADNRKGKVVGLLGNYNDNTNDDFALRNGTVIGGTITDQRLYGDYDDSWRITQTTSLFDYASGQTTTTFTNLAFPNNIVTIDTLTAEQRAAAEQIAQNAGITDPDILENAILDIALTNGAPEFITGYVDQQRQATVNGDNTLINPDGTGTQHWLSANAVIPYTIRFSNNAAQGTTPVAQVTITQQLDSDLDLNTFTLNDFGFGDITVDVPTGVKNYSQRLDLRTTRGVFVDVNAGLNTSTGVVSWTFTAIDPTTGNAANSTTQGFLPPNDQNDAGQGFVGYTIQPKANSITSARIDAQANITFNSQTPIQTTPVFNTLDGDAPTSKVNALSANSNPNFTVSWAGSDTGSGIAAYDIFVSTDGGQYSLWKDDITGISATYTGQAGHTYGFYSVATDNLGLTEVAPTQADTVTTVGNTQPVISLSANQSILEGLTSPQNVSYTVSLSNPSSQTITVGYATANGTAQAGSDYTNTTGTLTFSPGVTSQIINIPILNDAVNEGNETFTLTLTNPTNATLASTVAVTTTISDTLSASTTTTLPANVENLTLTGIAAINGTGNAGNNALTGNNANNTLSGEAGNDTLDGSGGVDTLIGGLGDDTYILDTTTDTITELASQGTDTIQSSVTISLAPLINIENVTLIGTNAIAATGNSGNNVLIGNSGNNTLTGDAGNDTLNGGAGIDTLTGGLGNDTYIVDTTTDTITELANQGTDTIESSITISLAPLINIENVTLIGTNAIAATGNSGNNVLTGNSKNNTLDGSAGVDTLTGGLGNDIYIVDTTTDTITEQNNAGTDTIKSSVTYSLATLANVENLTLTGNSAINGTGNAGNNVLIGNSGNNTLTGDAGNDNLNGDAGVDTLIGGLGNDTYVVDTTTDTITELANQGTDTIKSSVTYSLANLGNVENLTLTGNSAINGTGNAGNNVLIGNSGNNTLTGDAGNDNLNGGAGVDTLTGGLGDDIYVVDSTTDTITEIVGQGTDTVKSSVSYSLATLGNVENLTLTGTGAIDGTGNTSNNTITGNSGNNTLKGDAGDDTITGAAGNDIMYAESGNDWLIGGLGNDTLDGGAGTDTFAWDATALNSKDLVAGGVDTLLNAGGDCLNFTSQVENLLKIGGQKLASLAADTTLTNTVTSNISFGTGNSVRFVNSILQLDLDGNGSFSAASDFQISLNGVNSLTYNAVGDYFNAI